MNFLAFAAALVAIVWSTWFVLRGSLLYGCFGYFVAACCFANHFFSFDAAGLTWSLDRFYLALLVAAFVVQWRFGGVQTLSLRAADYLLFAFTGLLMISTVTHDYSTHSPDELPIIMHLVNGYLVPLAVYLIARFAIINERNVYGLHVAMALFGVYLALTAIAEIGGQWSLVFPRYIADEKAGIHFGRARGPMLQAATMGSMLVICLTAGWVSWVWQDRAGRWGRLLMVAGCPIFAAGLYFTYTRSCWLGGILSATIVLGLTLRGVWRPMFVGGIVACVLMVGVVKWNSLMGFAREDSAAVARESTFMRGSFAYVSWQMFQDRPWTGFGFGQFPRENLSYLNDRNTGMRLQTIRGYIHHNAFLSVLVETGLIGLGLYLALLAAWMRNAWKLWSHRRAPTWMRAHGLVALAAFGPYLSQTMFHDASTEPIANSLLYLLAGTASALLYGLEAKTKTSPARRTATANTTAANSTAGNLPLGSPT